MIAFERGSVAAAEDFLLCSDYRAEALSCDGTIHAARKRCSSTVVAGPLQTISSASDSGPLPERQWAFAADSVLSLQRRA